MKYFATNSVWAFAWVLVSSICVDGGNPKLTQTHPFKSGMQQVSNWYMRLCCHSNATWPPAD